MRRHLSQTTESASPATPVLDYQTAGPRQWQVGTLTYSTAGLIIVISWLLLGSIGLSFRDRAAPNSGNLLLNKLQASNVWIAVLTQVIPLGMGLLLGPIISYRSDRLRSRWGRRIPFLLFSAPIAVFAMIGVAFCPQVASQLDRLLGGRSPGQQPCALVVFGIFWTIFHFATVCGSAVLGGLHNDVLPRPVLGRFFGTFRSVSLVCGMIFNFFILGLVEAHFQIIFITIAAVFGGTVLLMCLMVREGEYPPPPPKEDQPGPRATFRATLVYFRECFSNPYYRWVLAAFALAGLTIAPVNMFSLFYAKSLGLDMSTYGRMMAINHFCGFFLAFPIGMLVDRFHALRMSMAAMALYALTVGLGSIFIQGPSSFLIAAFGHMVISGVYISASGALAQLLLPRLKFAQFASAAGLLAGVLNIAMSLALGRVLDLTGSNYRLTYVLAFGLATLTFVVLTIVHQKFMALGGPKGYVAPAPE